MKDFVFRRTPVQGQDPSLRCTPFRMKKSTLSSLADCARPSPRVLLFILALALMPRVPAQQDALSPSSNPEHITVAGNAVYFTADDGVHGRELWTSDGTASGTQLVKDLEPGPAGADFQLDHCGFAGGAFLFVARTRQQDWSLYRTDGTGDGTQLVFAFSPEGGGFVVPLAVIHDRLYLNVVSAGQPQGLWTSDGTHDGTHFLDQHDVPGVFSSLTTTDAGVLFLADPGSGGLYQTDGTPEGTFRRKEIFRHPNNLAALGDRVAFVCDGEKGGAELWVADAQPKSAHIIKQISQGGAGGRIGAFERFSDRLLFDSYDMNTGRELWRTDGTADGTRLLKDVNSGTPGSDPYSFTVVGSQCFFSAVSAEFGRELWVTDGTGDGTRMVRDIFPGYSSAEPYALRSEGNRLFFSATDGKSGEELWVSDGSEAGTRRVADINPGPMDSGPHGTVAMKGYIMFAATDPVYGRELWRSDGTEAGTILVKDINTRRQVNPSSSPKELTPAGALLFFAANDLEHGTELWATDGAETGTRLVRDICPGSPGSNPHYLTAFSGVLYFAANDGNFGDELWCSDGSTVGTRMVADINIREQSSAPRELSVDGEKNLFFVAFGGADKGNCIFSVDSTHELLCAVGTDRRPGVWNPRGLRVWNEWLYFSADDGVHGEELWRTNMRETVMVRDIVSLPKLGSLPHGLTATPDALFFAADDRQHGDELWRLDTRGEVRLVCDIRSPESYLPFRR